MNRYMIFPLLAMLAASVAFVYRLATTDPAFLFTASACFFTASWAAAWAKRQEEGRQAKARLERLYGKPF